VKEVNKKEEKRPLNVFERKIIAIPISAPILETNFRINPGNPKKKSKKGKGTGPYKEMVSNPDNIGSVGRSSLHLLMLLLAKRAKNMGNLRRNGSLQPN